MRIFHRRPTSSCVLVAALLTASAAPLVSQERPRWERRAEATDPGPTVFHATQALNLPTAVTAGDGEFLFEIAHRFLPAISADGTFFGLDGGVRYRLGLAYGITDRVMVGVTRSNLNDNLDLGGRIRLLEGTAPIPFQVALGGGMAWNKEVAGLQGGSTQYHASLVVNAAVGGRVALGVVPSMVSNPRLDQDGEDVSLSAGFHGQVYLSEVASLVGEWVLTDGTGEFGHDPVALSVELETGGHFFRVGVTNSLRLNPSQHLAGAAQPFTADELRLAFNITRVLAF